jgi:hypothetical protein
MQVYFQNITSDFLFFAFAKNEPLSDKLFNNFNFLSFIMFLHVEAITERRVSDNLTQKEAL